MATVVGFVGAGAIGAPMIGRMVGAGHRLLAYGRTEASRARAASGGAILVAEPTDVTEDAEVVVLCPFTDTQVLEIARGGVLAAMAPGSVLVIHTTGSPVTARTLAAEAPSDVLVVDAPVSGGAADIVAGRITLFVGGDDRAVDQAETVMASYGDPVLRVGSLGSGQAVKLLNNALFAAQLQLAADAARVADTLGIDPVLAATAVGHGSGASRALAILGGTPDRLQTLAPFLDKDVGVLRAVAAGLDVDLGLLDATNAAGARPFGPGPSAGPAA